MAMLVLALGAVGVFTQLSRTGFVGAPPDEAVVNPTEIPPAPPPPPPPPPVPGARPDPPAPAAPVILVAAFDAPADDPDLTAIAARLREELVAVWNGEPMAAAPAGRDPLEAASAAGSRYVVGGQLSRAEGQIRIHVFVLDTSTGAVRDAGSVIAVESAAASNVASLLQDVFRR
jgi:TolB-like protein